MTCTDCQLTELVCWKWDLIIFEDPKLLNTKYQVFVLILNQTENNKNCINFDKIANILIIFGHKEVESTFLAINLFM